MKNKITVAEKEALEAFRKVGQRGGKARAAKMSPAERKESARKAAQARWAKGQSRLGSRLYVPKASWERLQATDSEACEH